MESQGTKKAQNEYVHTPEGWIGSVTRPTSQRAGATQKREARRRESVPGDHLARGWPLGHNTRKHQRH